MDDATRATAPVHLWVIGLLGILWNGFSGFDFAMTVTANPAYLANYGPDVTHYLLSMPAWYVAFWALGVWSGLAGSLLLLARSKHAVSLLALSLVGLLVTTVYQFLLSAPPADYTTTNMLLKMLLAWAVAIGLFLYARGLQSRGLLGELT
ncbi:hypothetical protein [Sphingomonas sp.]|uniref:hypothetical protein n=1 Tax=Sphingomonas sp. TaxID=28214 RepID=UPI00286C116E|nr:hypothetical protein [Sphingomonas sp.]